MSLASANTCKGDEASRWLPQRSWPAACEPDAVTDGLVLLEGDALTSDAAGGTGELQVTVQRMVQGKPVETFEGKVSYPDSTSALFQSARPLAPQADYQITAARVSSDGSPSSNRFTSAFTTGVRALSPLHFADVPSLRYEEAETERFDCTVDACGVKNCQPGGGDVHVRSVRVGVPAIMGGVDMKPLAVSAKLVASFSSGQAPAVATSDTVATQAGKRSFLVLELPALAANAQGCVTISATDAAGHTLSSEPVCLALQADDAPYDQDLQGVQVLTELGLSQGSSASTASEPPSVAPPTQVEASAAQGCAIGPSKASVGGLGWLALALTLARLRRASPSQQRGRSADERRHPR